MLNEIGLLAFLHKFHMKLAEMCARWRTERDLDANNDVHIICYCSTGQHASYAAAVICEHLLQATANAAIDFLPVFEDQLVTTCNKKCEHCFSSEARTARAGLLARVRREWYDVLATK